MVLAHPRQLPAEPLLQAKLLQKLEVGRVVEADEVVVPLEKAVLKGKAARETSEGVLLFVQGDLGPVLEQPEGRRQAREAAAYDGHPVVPPRGCHLFLPGHRHSPSPAGASQVSGRHWGP